MDFENIALEKKDRIAFITLNRPEVFNALNGKMVEELECAFFDIARDDSIAVIIVTGAGEKAFAAGADISELSRLDPLKGEEVARKGQRAYQMLETMGKPSIAAINGFALGGGCELALACTVRVASEKAKLGQPEVNLGIIPGYAGTQRLSRIVGKGIALDLILTGRTIDAQEASRIGLVSKVVPHDKLMDEARGYAAKFLEKGPLALRAAMETINRGFDLDFENGCRLEASFFGLLCSTQDMKEGTGAFLEKRKPQFKGK